MTKRNLKDFSVNHRLMTVEPTQEMSQLLAQIQTLKTAYDKLEEVEQKRELNQYKALLRSNGYKKLEALICH